MTRLRFERLNRGLTQTQLATLAGIPQPTLSSIEIGRLQPSDRQLRKLSRVMQLPEDVLLSEVRL